MKDARMVLPLAGAVLVLVGLLGVLGRADKPASPPGLSKPLMVCVSGEIAGEGERSTHASHVFI